MLAIIVNLKQYIKDSYRRLKTTNILSNFFNLSSIQVSNLLLLFVTIRIITGKVGIEGFGMIMFANRFSMLAGTIINYGTTQSGIRDITYNQGDPNKFAIVLCNILGIRIIIFLPFLIGIISVYGLFESYYSYLLLAIPLVLAEVFNPLCFFIGIEKIKIFNVYNLSANLTAVVAILIFVKDTDDAIWVNFILGMGNVITYLALLIYLTLRFKLVFHTPLKKDLLSIAKNNFSLTINNISANLQQSVIIFALKWTNSDLLGAYTLCDRFIGQCRNLLNILSNAVYPNAVSLYKQSAVLWDSYRKRNKYLFATVSFAAAIVIFIFSDFIVYTLSKKHDPDAIVILRIMAFVPVISAVNVFSMLDLLLKNNSKEIFKIAIVLIALSAFLAFILTRQGGLLIGTFTLIVEISAGLMYEYVIKKTALKNA